ncbi:putative glycoside hydrolase [Gordonia effusa NBRC 100432]|uniref:Alpha-galactosidase n=1 Tax=Gordonia effusa NBRC 100432 TaxID=1077974 RepID=H0R0I6_9ACTN|nr:glycoside hydrolase family 27 protein [Gordonia effusa]GAB18587.1 putative glycoside hydrolase [Gordonia effusa NBRC 100432]
MRRRLIRLSLALTALLSVVIVTACVADPPTRVGGDGVAVPGVAPTPPMGWNSWQPFGCAVTEAQIRAQADALVSSGLRDAGYRYVVVDDCWNASARANDGALQADSTRFPSGMAALGEYLHERGLKFGVYVGASDKTCTQYQGHYPGATGSRGVETRDAATLASWGADFVKADWCSSNGRHDDQVQAFTAWRNALRAVGRPMVLSINPNSGVSGTPPGQTYDWGGVATMTRVTNDIAPTFDSVLGIADAVGLVAPRTRIDAFNDPDMLVVGQGLSTPHARTHMSLWAMMAAPLMLGTDLTRLSTSDLSLVANKAMVALDQDARVVSGAPVAGDAQVWSRAIGHKGLAVSMTNRTSKATTITVSLASLGLTGDTVAGVDVWTSKRYQARDGALSVRVAPGDTALLEIV